MRHKAGKSRSFRAVDLYNLCVLAASDILQELDCERVPCRGRSSEIFEPFLRIFLGSQALHQHPADHEQRVTFAGLRYFFVQGERLF